MRYVFFRFEDVIKHSRIERRLRKVNGCVNGCHIILAQK